MGILIGNYNTDNYGEKVFAQKAQEYFDDNHIIYCNRQIYGREFDICILIPDKGILVVEVKGWRKDNILRVENNESIVINTNDGEILSSPQKQARGYRFTIEKILHRQLKRFPLVFQMVCLPQVSKEFYISKRLDVVLEEKFTFLEEDLATNTSFFSKLDQALREVCNWRRDAFDSRAMLEVRNLFETNIELGTENDASKSESSISNGYHKHDYSRFYYLNSEDVFTISDLNDIVNQYLCGCKLYCVFSNQSQMTDLVNAIDSALSNRGLFRDGENIFINFDNKGTHYPKLKNRDSSFIGFHISFSVLQHPLENPIPSFHIRNGVMDDNQKISLFKLSNLSLFNAEQYLVEHASPNKNIVVRAGAGTGKTYTMISRIGYICYTQNVPIQRMADYIVMITFTNEAADQMAVKLKTYFRNCFLLTSNSDYLNMITQIDHMQISTIHSYAKQLIAQLGSSFGFGVDVEITSSDYFRRKKISDILDRYIKTKQKELGINYTSQLGMPIYEIRNNILDFINKLHNKSIDISSISSEDFGQLIQGGVHQELHDLLSNVIPEVEREYYEELLENNRIHLGSMMSILHRFVTAPENQSRICELKSDDKLQFMFVDEFQDTDDTQIDCLLSLAKLLKYKLFLVGDIKQCIYRFRGAKEKAFDRLNIDKSPDQWLQFSLQRNYRTDSALLDLFDNSFTKWGSRYDELLAYNVSEDRLIGTRKFNDYITQKKKYFKKITITSDKDQIDAIVKEIQRIQTRIKYEKENRQLILSKKDRSIAILVRENWQAEMIRKECSKKLPGITIQTNTGGDLYMSQPAIDMMLLVNALVHFDEAEYLYGLITSNFFKQDIPRSNLYNSREKIRSHRWKGPKADEHEQANLIIYAMNQMLVNMDKDVKTWEKLVVSLRSKPVLQVLRQVYNHLEPWKNFSDNEWKQHYYQMNVDLLFEQLMNSCNIDRLTINTLQERLYNCIISQTPVDSRIPSSEEGSDIIIQCITVHKAKGLEYGHVILPFCSAPIDRIKQSQLHINTSFDGNRYRIGYSLHVPDTGITLQNDCYDELLEKAEKSREETRILYVAMTRAMRSFSWIAIEGKENLSWQNLIETEE